MKNDELHTYSDNSAIVVERIKHLPIGGRMKDIPQHLWHQSYVRTGEKKTGGPNLRLLRLDPGLPSNTITAYVFNKFVHPFEDRFITPREAARLQQFPDTHKFAGPVTSVQLQIGNAVPVGLAQAVAKHISERLLKNGFANKPKAVSLFSGAGGMDLGFRDFFNVITANELVPAFAETLKMNFPESHILQGDLKNFRAGDLNPQNEDVQVVFGGPPCQPFSAAGKHGGVNDPRGAMIDEFLRVVDELKPAYFIMENVPGLVSNAQGGALRFIEQRTNEVGYAVEHFVLTATDYGVPQSRRRLFIIGRRDVSEPELSIPVPTHNRPGLQASLLLDPCRTVGDAILDLDPANPRSGIQRLLR